VIHTSDQLLGRFSDMLIDAASIRPAINISSLLGLKEHDSNKKIIKNNPFASISKNKAKLTKVDVKKKSVSVEKGLFELFVSHLDLSASAFSHLEYMSAQSHLDNALKLYLELKELVEGIMRSRSGILKCKDMRKETTFEGTDEDHIHKHVKGKFEKKFVENRRWTWFFGIIGSIFIGALIGYDVSTTKVKRGIE
jgi:hypothetical protein